jgi:predicted nucleic acid-binding protein
LNGSLIDTNVISEFAKANPDPNVIRWFQAADPDTLFASVVTLGEIRLGIEDLPMGKRRRDLELWLTTGLPAWFAANLLPVTKEIAERWGRATIEAKRNGLMLATADGLIAATALDHDLTLITRNTKDFAGLGVALLNPWNP